MAAGVSKFIFLFLILSILCVCSSSGFSHHARHKSKSSSSPIRAVSLIKLSKVFKSQILPNSGEPDYFYLDKTLVESLENSKSWLKDHINTIASVPHANLKGIALCGSCYGLFRQNDWPKLLSDLNSVRSMVKSLQLGNKFEVSALFESSFLDDLSQMHGNEKLRVLLKKIQSFVIVDANMDGKLNIEEYQISPSSRRVLKTTIHDATFPPMTTTPTPIVTVPATNPITITPNPNATPVTVPGNPPVPITNPVTTPATGTVPGAQTNPVTTYPAPVGNVPVTTPPGLNPVVSPPVTTNVPAIPGQSWCVAMTGSQQAALQLALDYACGLGGVDCSQIQQGGSCFNPSTLQNHASYAFNSYYQKNPVPTSCDFGGTAMIVNNNPSAGSCIYLTSAASSSTTPATPTPLPTGTTPPITPTTPITTPITNPVTTPITNPVTTPITNPVTTPTMPATPPAGTGFAGYGSPPSVLNSSNPANVYGSEIPPAVISPTSSTSTGLKPFIGCIVLIISVVIRTINFHW